MTIRAATNAAAVTKIAWIRDLIRPRNHIKAYLVNPAGGTGVFTTINAAITQVKADLLLAPETLALNALDVGPQTRRLILIDPGTYNESINTTTSSAGTLPPFVDFVGTSGNPADTIITFTGNFATFNASNSMYLSGLKCYLDGLGTSTGVHALNGGGFPLPGCIICDNCIFESHNTAVNGPNAINPITSDDLTYLFLQCTFIQGSETPGGCQAVQLGTQAGTRKRPGAIIFYECIASAFSNSSIVNFLESGGAQYDLQVWIGGSIIDSGGTATSKINIIQLNAGSKAQFIVDPIIAANQIAGPNLSAAQLTRAKIEPQFPVAGMTEPMRRYYGTANRYTPQVLQPQTPDAVAAAVVANRMYYVPVRITELVRVAGMVQGVVSAAGHIAGGVYLDDRTGKPGVAIQRRDTSVLATAGALSLGAMTYTQRLLYPGNEQVWAGLVCDDATATLVCSALLSTTRTVYYQDLTPGFASIPPTATPLALAAGVACPLPGLTCI